MSAICGIIHFDGKPVDREHLETMVESSPYRGPDGTGYWVEGNAGFAHMAFHVTPESVHEKQPLVSQDGRYVLCADVRLDNRDELFSKLEIRKDPDRVVTDPDLIMAAWLKWGNTCPEHFLGDFVFSVWDTREKSLFIARDPLGAYCVQYHKVDDCFLFASELTAIMDLPFIDPMINEDRVLREIEYLPRGHEETFFKDMFYLAPAHCMEIGAGRIKTWRYWDINPDFKTRFRTDDEYAERLLHLIDQAVADRIRCIGPVGISLSGGNDSTLLAASAARQLSDTEVSRSRLKSFSYVFERFHECNERPWIEPVVQQFDLEAHFIEGDQLNTFNDVKTRSVPASYLWTNCMYRLPEAVAQQAQMSGCRVLINGQFGDALFDGPNLTVADKLRQGRLFAASRYLFSHREEIGLKNDFLLNGLAKALPDSFARQYIKHLRGRNTRTIGGLTPNKSKKAQQIQFDQFEPIPPKELLPGARRRYSALLRADWAMAAAEGRTHMGNNFGFEPTSPLGDRRLMEFILSVPSEHISKPGQRRFLQTNAMKKVLPEAVCIRDSKSMYSTFVEYSMASCGKSLLEKVLKKPGYASNAWIERSWLQSQLSVQNWDDFGFALCLGLHLELWLQQSQNIKSTKANWAPRLR